MRSRPQQNRNSFFLRACIIWGALIAGIAFLISVFTSGVGTKGTAAGSLYMIMTVWLYTRAFGSKEIAPNSRWGLLLLLLVTAKFAILGSVLYLLSRAGANELLCFLLGAAAVLPAALQTAYRAH